MKEMLAYTKPMYMYDHAVTVSVEFMPGFNGRITMFEMFFFLLCYLISVLHCFWLSTLGHTVSWSLEVAYWPNG